MLRKTSFGDSVERMRWGQAGLGSISAYSGPNSAKFGSVLTRVGPLFDQHRQSPHKLRLNSTNFGPTSINIRPESIKFGPTSNKFGLSSAKFARLPPKVAGFDLLWADAELI